MIGDDVSEEEIDFEMGTLFDAYYGRRRKKMGRRIGFLSRDLSPKGVMTEEMMAAKMKNTSKYPGGGKPVKSVNVKKRGYDAKDEQGKQSPTAKPGAFGPRRSLSREISKGLKKAR